jgi:hypothetical protein
MKQSFYVAMGGLCIHDEELLPDHFALDGKGRLKESRKRRTDAKLTAASLKELAEAIPDVIPTILPRITKADIDDKSKADLFIKAWLTIQASWFCVQCLFRLISGYSISLLELNTLAHCTCAFLIYWWWREKPFGVFESSPLDMRQHLDLLALLGMHSSFSSNITYSELDCLHYRELDPSKELNESADMEEWKVMFGKSLHGFSIAKESHNCKFHLKKAPYSQNYPLQRHDIRRWEQASRAIHNLGLRGRHHRRWKAAATSQDIRDIMDTRNTLVINSSTFRNLLVDRVNEFAIVRRITNEYLLFLGCTVSGMIYGALHATAWNAPFPTKGQHIMWRISSVTLIASGPVVWLTITASRITRFVTQLYYFLRIKMRHEDPEQSIMDSNEQSEADQISYDVGRFVAAQEGRS